MTLRPPPLAVSPNEQLKRFAAGALFNTVEAIHREAQLKSLDSQVADSVGDDDTHVKSHNSALGVLSTMFAEKEDEVELSEEVLAQLGKREAAKKEEEDEMLEAVVLIQGAWRTKKTKQTFALLRRLAVAVRVVTKAMLHWRRRRYRKASLILQAHARAYILHSVGICERRVALAVILGCRRAYNRSLYRMVARRFVLKALEAKRRKAQIMVTSAKKASGRGLIKTRVKIADGKNPERPSGGSDRLGGGGGGDELPRRHSDPTEAAKDEKAKITATGAALVSSLATSASRLTIPKASSVTGRIPIFVKKGWGTPQTGTPSKATPQMTPQISPRHSQADSSGYGVEDIESGGSPGMRTPTLKTTPQQKTPSTGVRTPSGSLSMPRLDTGLIAVAATKAAAAAGTFAPSDASAIAASKAEMDRRKMTASASSNVLARSQSILEQGAEDELPEGYMPPVRRLFAPGKSADKLASFVSSSPGSGLAAATAKLGPLQRSTSYADMPTRAAASLSSGSAGDVEAGIPAGGPLATALAAGGALAAGPTMSAGGAVVPRLSLRQSASCAGVIATAKQRVMVNALAPLSKAATGTGNYRTTWDPSKDPDVDLGADLEGGWRPARPTAVEP